MTPLERISVSFGLENEMTTNNGYKDIFDVRGKSYNLAAELCPEARSLERQLLLDLLLPEPGERIIDAPAGGGYLADALSSLGAKPLCLEPSEQFAAGLSSDYQIAIAPMTDMPFVDGYADKLGSLAGLHHLSHSERRCVFSEAFRVLKPGGVIAVADVLADTKIASFLNGPVDRYTSTGHDGLFFSDGEFSDLFASAGFKVASEQYHEFAWSFPDEATMVHFMTQIFGLTKACPDTVYREVTNSLDVRADATGVHVGWGLLYAHAVK
ncbi:class I SAM-dependent methyltransferase [Marinobacter hydrocarbonoclasticus]|uniref:class I SAM-dependent methyltransferase n=1 Tax=Marinobacter nauticus TaxID=2743 RepID=UPI001C954E1A|nr:class I SAM-dependent methyltransferase [Marinobacter nauticus]MBY6192912.1 class I SAM-dependent methyltransferase [Marinobacter nauticus]MBY6214060.1 class I SAM-dependent methyltransferase [Marinobacter nauticus]